MTSKKNLVFSILFFLLYLPASALAADCGQGGNWNCSCGDTLVGSVTMTDDMNCNGTALYIGANNITLECQGHTIDGINDPNSTAINNSAGYNNFTLRNCVISNHSHGLIDGYIGPGGGNIAENGTIENNTFYNITSDWPNLLVGSGKLYNNNTFSSGLIVLFSNPHTGGVQNTTAFVNLTKNRFNSTLAVWESTNVLLSNNKINNSLLVTGNHPNSTASSTPSYNIIVDENDFGGTDLNIMNMTNSIMQNNYNLSSITVNESTNVSLNNNTVCEGNGTIHLTSNSHNNSGDNICNASKITDEADNNVTCLWDCNGQPNCGAILESDLNLTKDLTCSGSALTVNSSNVTVDCQCHSIIRNSPAGGQNYGINGSGISNVTVKNCIISNSLVIG